MFCTCLVILPDCDLFGYRIFCDTICHYLLSIKSESILD